MVHILCQTDAKNSFFLIKINKVNEQQKAMLIIMDGWGINRNPTSSAIEAANTPFTDSLYLNFPNTGLLTHGEFVGLPEEQMGNSEVGHMNLGAGRVVYQDLMLINKKAQSGELAQNEILLKAFEFAKSNNKNVHFIGLVSDGGIHSHINHLKTLIKSAKEHGVISSFVHAFTDGRDTDPKSGLRFIQDLQEFCQTTPTKIASVCGRYFAMDRDNRWERIKLAYDLLLSGNGNKFDNAIDGVKASYVNNITDEFIEPIVVVNEQKQPIAVIENDDVVICFNFRTDRCREISTALTQKDMPDFGMETIPLYYVTMTIYDSTFKNVHTIFGKDNISDSLGEVIAKNGLTQLRIAETEKYPHVTFFFSGGREELFEGEARIMIPSPKVTTYDLQPEMSAYEIKDAVIQHIEENEPDFICLNFANADMVGHTGVFAAAVKAAETVDTCVEAVIEKALEKKYVIFLTADHGNADYIINEDGTPNTAHTKNIVPLFLISNFYKGTMQPGRLADIAPSILKIMNLEIPDEMDGTPLF
ncbi:MAG: 2,3-bisphosphoglycerate-independent phosphoglycerate mutase [Chitinophagales bacterium]|jgi:2,3-bisphosphoglycerate-independent phosphoglycerate mutase|nr:2,3-bisphosphoglycerate-independent phosphoglycerate mutase [Chitinophagales bacterium]MBP6154199.1 2,3-bisphosphoglycerate-independent phosphoglycerate mutase [Chitinophagales bacterium]